MHCASHSSVSTVRPGGVTKEDSMDPKLTMLFVLFGGIIGLSNLRPEHLTRVRNLLAFHRWRKSAPG
jgi:hypothetical protein